MDVTERNRIIGVVTFFIGLILIIFVLPILIRFNYLQYFIIGVQECLILDIFVLAIALFLYTYFIIRPIKTLKGKKILAIVAMIFGGVLVVITLIGIGIYLAGFLEVQFDLFSVLYFWWVILIPFILLLIPGIILFIHGWYLRKNLRIENNS